jgi:hypothetical protein
MYSSTFIKSQDGSSESFLKICQAAEALLTQWRNAVPARRTFGYSVSSYRGSGWVRIDGTLQPETERLLSEILSLDVIGIYVLDEHVLDFSFKFYRNGQDLRSLRQTESEGRLTWNDVSGQEQAWEAEVFFDPGDSPMYLRAAEDDSQRAERTQILSGRRIIRGADVPWAADVKCLERLSDALELPWLKRSGAPQAVYEIAPLAKARKSAGVWRLLGWAIPPAASFVAFTLAWIIVCLFNNGDAFPQGAAVWLLPLPMLTPILAWRAVVHRSSRVLWFTIGLLAVACGSFWVFAPNGWWATPPAGM